MSRKRPALGRGLGALIPERIPDKSGDRPSPRADTEAPRPDPSRDVAPRSAPIEALEPNPEQPRRRFERGALEDLAASIRSVGIIQPIVVTAKGPGRYEILAGERRWRAAQLAGLHEVPILLRDTPEEVRFEVALIENLQRADLDPIEEAQAFQQLIDIRGYTQEELAGRVGKDRSTIANALRLLGLPPKVQILVSEGALSMGHARALLGLEQATEMRELASEIIRRKLSVRATEAEVRRRRKARAEAEAELSGPSDEHRRQAIIIADLETRLRRSLGTKVKLLTSKRGKGPGKIEIPYGDLDELNRLLHVLLAAAGPTSGSDG